MMCVFWALAWVVAGALWVVAVRVLARLAALVGLL